jgi:hypothetical protein
MMEAKNFNQQWVKSVSEEEFIKHEAHNASAEELSRIYREINPKKKSPSGHGSQPPSESVREVQAP